MSMGLFDGQTTTAAELPGGDEARAVTYQNLFAGGLDVDGYGTSTVAGVNVSSSRAMCLSAVFGSVRILTEGVATLPASARQGADAAAVELARQPHWIGQPSENIGWVDLMTQGMISLLHDGNAYIFTPRDEQGRILYLVPIAPSRVHPTHEDIPADGSVGWWVDGVPFSRFDLLHIRGMSMPGKVLGMSPLTYARETVGLGLAAQQYGASLFGNGAVPGSVIETQAEPSPEARKVMHAEWNLLHQGSTRAHRMAIIGGGATFKTISVTPEDAQFLETRGFQVSDVARFFGVPPHLLADATGSTSWGSGLAEQNNAYKIHSLRPWVERWEQGLSWLARSERADAAPGRRVAVRLSMEHLSRGDFASQVTAVAEAVAAGLMTVNEGRRMLGMAPMPGGDQLQDPVPALPAGSME